MVRSLASGERYPITDDVDSHSHGVWHHCVMASLVEIASFGTTFGAEVAAAHLESLGIHATVATDDAGGAIPSMTGLGAGARLLVRSEDAERATDALESMDDDGENA